MAAYQPARGMRQFLTEPIRPWRPIALQRLRIVFDSLGRCHLNELREFAMELVV